MSGAKRGSSYRKSLTQAVESYPVPEENERIVRVFKVIGKHIEVTEASGKNALCLLPQRFHRVIWIKRGDFLIVSVGDEEQRVRFQVEHVLQKDQIKHIKKQNLWPQFQAEGQTEIQSNNENDDDDEKYQQEDDKVEDILFINPNHANRRRDRSPSTSSSSSDSQVEEEERSGKGGLS
mmetsp:Transcript_15209/g.20115  ORF Transcript_15209/g.20115 Transcript_15209/m.20115 type:complete len:178 (+) Transcript_15209:43-576(+)